MTARKKPVTPEEVQDDIDNHPDRGKINGEPVLALDRQEVRGTCSGEAKRKLIRVMSVYGWDFSEGLSMAIAALWDKERHNVEAHEQEKAQKFGVTTQEIRNKEYGAYKDRSRRKRANITSTEVS
jgi:hypothetical protein